MDADLAFIIGAFGDGCLTSRPKRGDYSIEFEQKNKQWLESLSKKFKKVFGKSSEVKKTSKGYYRFRVYSKNIFFRLKDLLENISQITNEKTEAKTSFLRGIFDAEGSVHKNRYAIVLTNKDRELIFLCRKLLHELNISCGKIWCDKRTNVLSLSVYGKHNLIKFNNLIGSTHYDKQVRLNNHIISCGTPRTEL